MSFADDNLEQTDQGSETSNPYRQPRSTRQKLAPITLLCVLVIGGGIMAYRYFGSSDGPGPQTAAAGPTRPLPNVVTPSAPKPEEWVNPAFKGLSPKETTILRAKIAAGAVRGFLETGQQVGQFRQWLESLPVAEKKPTKAEIEAARAKAAAAAKAAAEAALEAARPKPIALAPGIEPGTFKVSGIMSNGSNSMVVINGGVYRVGQKVSGAVVESINPKRVILIIDEQKFWVGM